MQLDSMTSLGGFEEISVDPHRSAIEEEIDA
jgi:hypothetical protein